MLPSPRDPINMFNTADKSETQRRAEILGRHTLPTHWQPPSPIGPLGKLRRIFFHILCLFSYGEHDLEFLWVSLILDEEGDTSAWTQVRRRTAEQLNNILVVAGLLLTTSAVFMTTSPPDPLKLDYTRRGAYLCIYGAFGLLIGGIIVILISILVVNKLKATHTRKVLYGNALHVHFMLIIMSYPPLTVGIATLILAFGLLSAAWVAIDPGFQFGGMIMLLMPISMGVLFAIVNIRVSPKETEPKLMQELGAPPLKL